MAEDPVTFAELTRQRGHRQPRTIYDVDGIVQLRLDEPSHDPREVLEQLSEPLEREVGRGTWPTSVYVLNDKPFSRGRDWHTDDFPSTQQLLPPEWVTVVVAYGTCPAGTLEYVPGSHRWPVAERDVLLSHLEAEYHGYGWRERTEAFLAPAFREELERQRCGRTQRPRLQRGSVLVFHPWLWHRSDRDLERDALVLQCELVYPL